ncbi:MAG TPA: replication-relaxation family protein [Vicinamibacterales bacterium]|nr:replication-relaxation family protein [Vicinamibacterales bacterium]
MPTPDPHLPRFVRHRFRKPPFVLQARDTEIVRLVEQHRVITSDNVRLLVGGSGQNVLRRLQKLFHAGYLDRPRSQRTFGNLPFAYALGQRGAELLAGPDGRKPTVDWSEKNRQLTVHYLHHALMVSEFQTALRHAAAASGTIRLEHWLPDGIIREAAWIHQDGRRTRVPVSPDAVFVLNSLDSRQAGRVCGVLEADRGTMTVARFTLKLAGYFAWWRSGEAERRLGFRNFLVATVARTDERAEHLRAAARAVSNKGLRMFVFCSEGAYAPVPRAAVFQPIWKTPADTALHSLLE